MRTNALKGACLVLVILVWLPPALVWSAPLMHSVMGLKPHPLATPFHGKSTGEESNFRTGSLQALTNDAPIHAATFLQEYSPFINMMPMLIFSVGLVLLIVFGVHQKHSGIK